MRQWRQKRRDEFFADKDCADCGSTDDLQLHHVDNTDRLTSAWLRSPERLAEELAKCVILCRKCHMEGRHGRVLKHGTKKCYDKGCRCEECREASAEYKREWRRKNPKKMRAQRQRAIAKAGGIAAWRAKDREAYRRRTTPKRSHAP